LRRPDLAALPDGRHAVAGDRLYASIEHRAGRGREGAPAEFHRRYVDIQYMVSGIEVIGWRALQDCTQVATPYDAERDVGFYAESPRFWMAVQPGEFAIFLPDDVHAPLAGEGPVHKVVMKIEMANG
jgi:YhcH/YjgK/YiaL family protein